MIANRSDTFYRRMFLASALCNLVGVDLAFGVFYVGFLHHCRAERRVSPTTLTGR